MNGKLGILAFLIVKRCYIPLTMSRVIM
jgi:hypothetical protein